MSGEAAPAPQALLALGARNKQDAYTGLCLNDFAPCPTLPTSSS